MKITTLKKAIASCVALLILAGGVALPANRPLIQDFGLATNAFEAPSINFSYIKSQDDTNSYEGLLSADGTTININTFKISYGYYISKLEYQKEDNSWTDVSYSNKELTVPEGTTNVTATIAKCETIETLVNNGTQKCTGMTPIQVWYLNPQISQFYADENSTLTDETKNIAISKNIMLVLKDSANLEVSIINTTNQNIFYVTRPVSDKGTGSLTVDTIACANYYQYGGKVTAKIYAKDYYDEMQGKIYVYLQDENASITPTLISDNQPTCYKTFIYSNAISIDGTNYKTTNGYFAFSNETNDGHTYDGKINDISGKKITLPREDYEVSVTGGTVNGQDMDYFLPKKTATVTANSNSAGGWYINNKLVSIKKTYTFYVLRDTAIEWRESAVASTGLANLELSDRTQTANNKVSVTFASSWEIPDGATIKKAGIYRTFIDKNAAKLPTQKEMLKGTFKSATDLTKDNYCFILNMGTTSASKKLCAMTYIQYELNGKKYAICSNIITSEEELV